MENNRSALASVMLVLVTLAGIFLVGFLIFGKPASLQVVPQVSAKGTPDKILQLLKDGNGRFSAGKSAYLHSDPARIGLMGSSLGAATATIAMGEDAAIAATWADSAYSEFDVAAVEYTENGGYPGWVTGAGVFVGRILSGDPLGDRDPAQALRQLDGRPYAIVHCDADRVVFVHHAGDNAAIAAAAGTDVTPWILPGCGHVDAMFVAPDEYERRLLAFFTDALGAPTTG